MDPRLKALLIAYKRKYTWDLHARKEQHLPPGAWRQWLILAGRGFGKTRTGAEAVRRLVETKQARRIALIGQTLKEAEAVMVSGKSGLLSVCPYVKPKFEATKHVLTFSHGATARLFGGDAFESLRGPQFDLVWIDEFCKFRYPKEVWEQVQLTLRLGQTPRCIITTTPRPIGILEEIMKDTKTFVTKGTTFDNSANLAPSFLSYMKETFATSSLGAQEIYGELLNAQEGALWKRDMMLYRQGTSHDFSRVVIAIDPAMTYHNESDETGIIVAAKGQGDTFYVLDDLSGRFSPLDWAERVVKAFYTYQADRVVAEVNAGGDMVERIIASVDSTLPYKSVRAIKGKRTRAEPIAALYEKRRVFHARPFTELEHQLCHFVAGSSPSPDRLDALVWALTELSEKKETPPSVWSV